MNLSLAPIFLYKEIKPMHNTRIFCVTVFSLYKNPRSTLPLRQTDRERVIYSGKWRCKSQNIMVSLVQNALPCKLNKYCHQHPTNNALSASALTACWDVHAQCIKRVCVYVYVFMYVCMWGHGDGVSANWRLLLETSLLQTTCRFCSVPHSYHISLSFFLFILLHKYMNHICVCSSFFKGFRFCRFQFKRGQHTFAAVMFVRSMPILHLYCM